MRFFTAAPRTRFYAACALGSNDNVVWTPYILSLQQLYRVLNLTSTKNAT